MVTKLSTALSLTALLLIQANAAEQHAATGMHRQLQTHE